MKTVIAVKIIPNAKSNEAVGLMDDGAIKIRIKAKPIEGKANQQLIKFLKKELGINADDISIESGEKSRRKNISIDHLTADQIKSILLKD